jgi:putative transposase
VSTKAGELQIVPSDRLRRELDEVLAGVGEHDDPVEAVARLGARLIMQQALEDEVTEFLGRERYERASRAARSTATVMSRGR